jgi:glutathione S-transferase
VAQKLIIYTLDWVPEGPRGFVRDLRLRWAAEEAGLPYEVRTVPFEDRETNHLDRQPFGQVPYLADGDVAIFESGACLLHIARQSEKLMPRDAPGAAATVQWVFAALNSIEMVTVPWWFLEVTGQKDNGLVGWWTSGSPNWRPCCPSVNGSPPIASPSPTSSWLTSCALQSSAHTATAP